MASNEPGYLLPTSSEQLPGDLSLEDFIQTVITGISGLPGQMVRPKWQLNPPKQPQILDNWIAFGISSITPDANAYNGQDADDNNELKRNETIEVQLAFYGPNAMENISVFRDGLWIQQNLESMFKARMGFRGIGPANRIPDLINERWVDRYEVTLVLVREVVRTYPILSFASVRGVLHTVLDGENYTQDFETEEPS